MDDEQLFLLSVENLIGRLLMTFYKTASNQDNKVQLTWDLAI